MAPSVAQLLVVCANPEQAAVFLHHVDARAAIRRIDHDVQRPVLRQRRAQRPQAEVRVGQMVQHAGADDLVEDLSETPYVFDRKPAEIEVPEVVFSLKIAGVAEAGLADVDPDHRASGSRIA